MSKDLIGILIATLIACVIWELDERQVMKKHKKKKLTSVKKKKNNT